MHMNINIDNWHHRIVLSSETECTKIKRGTQEINWLSTIPPYAVFMVTNSSLGDEGSIMVNTDERYLIPIDTSYIFNIMWFILDYFIFVYSAFVSFLSCINCEKLEIIYNI